MSMGFAGGHRERSGSNNSCYDSCECVFAYETPYLKMTLQN